MKNQELSAIFDRIAASLEFEGELPFKVNAYRRVARLLTDYPEDIQLVHQENRLKEIPGVGEKIANKIAEYLQTGRMQAYEDAIHEVPEELFKLLDISGLGPKTLRLVYDKLAVRDIEGLKKVVADGTLAGLPGMGGKKVENIRKGLERFQEFSRRIFLGVAYPISEKIVELLSDKVERISPAGSLRRMKETIGDIDILVAGGPKIIEEFTSLPTVKEVLAAGETKASVLVRGGTQVDLRVVPKDCYGAALVYFTGSKDHNIKLRHMAKERGWKINEYGIFKGEKVIAANEEEDIYRKLNLSFIPPEIREDRGEIEAAAEGQLPKLFELQDVKGDFHIHSEYSDGVDSLEQLAEKGRKMKYQYIVICDHTRSAAYAGGLSAAEMLKRNEEIDRLNRSSSGCRLLKGVEMEILADGSLDYPAEMLKRFDFVMAAAAGWKSPTLSIRFP